MNKITHFKKRLPSYGQEGGGVYWNPWIDSTKAEFLEILNSANPPSTHIRAHITEYAYLEIQIGAFTGARAYILKEGAGVDGREVSREVFMAAFNDDCVTDPVLEIVDVPQEYMYRYRHFKRPDDAWKQNCGWSEWEFCDAKKYAEIVHHIKDNSCTYEAQKIPVVPEESFCFDLKARGWHVPMYRYRERLHDDSYTNWVVITRDHMWKLKRSETDRRDAWYEFEISRDGGENWEDL